MSQVSPGWYPDPSGRFVQRYHDGARWTEHVADASGNMATDTPAGQGGPGRAGGGAGPGRSAGWEQQQAQGWGREPGAGSLASPGVSGGDAGPGWQTDRDWLASGQGAGWESGSGSAPGQPTSWGQGSPWGEGRQPGSGPGGYGGQGQPPAYGDQRAYGEPPYQGRQARYGQPPGRGQQAYGQRPGAGQWPGYGPPDSAYGAPPGGAGTRGFTPTVGLVVTSVGALLLVLSLFALDFIEANGGSLTLSDVNDFRAGVPGALDAYAGFGRFLAFLVVVGAVLAVLRVIPQLDVPSLPVIVAVVCGGFALWHVLAMLVNAEGADTSPEIGAIVGLIGYVGMAAGQFLHQPLGTRR